MVPKKMFAEMIDILHLAVKAKVSWIRRLLQKIPGYANSSEKFFPMLRGEGWYVFPPSDVKHAFVLIIKADEQKFQRNDACRNLK